jgi:hypothetical protein
MLRSECDISLPDNGDMTQTDDSVCGSQSAALILKMRVNIQPMISQQGKEKQREYTVHKKQLCPRPKGHNIQWNKVLVNFPNSNRIKVTINLIYSIIFVKCVLTDTRSLIFLG